jgi:hypothetical protein
MLAASVLQAKKEELKRLEALAEQLISRIDILRSEISLNENPWPDEEVTPVRPSRWRK